MRALLTTSVRVFLFYEKLFLSLCSMHHRVMRLSCLRTFLIIMANEVEFSAYVDDSKPYILV